MISLYLASPIDFAKTRTPEQDELEFRLKRLPDTAIYWPGQAWSVRSPIVEVDPRLEQVNREALTRVDALLAILPAGVESIGVPREIEQAKTLGIPWAVVTDKVGSFSLADCQNLFRLSRIGVDQAISWVKRLKPAPIGQDGLNELIFAKEGARDGTLPTRAHAGDAGWDLYTADWTEIAPGAFQDVSCGVRVALPPGVWGRIVGRSSTLRSRQLMVSEGTIDTGYRGALFAGVWNLGQETVEVKPGERIAQLILMQNESARYRARWASADEFKAIPHDGRGEASFGSTGA